MGYNKEYNADQVLEILKMDDPVSEFEKSMDNMSHFCHMHLQKMRILLLIRFGKNMKRNGKFILKV